MAEVSDSDDESQLSMMRRFLALLAAKAAWAALAQAATFTGSGTDDQGNTITFTLTETIAPATLYFAANGGDANNCKSQATPCQNIAKLDVCGFESKAPAGFRSRRGDGHDRTPVAPQNAAFPTYKAPCLPDLTPAGLRNAVDHEVPESLGMTLNCLFRQRLCRLTAVMHLQILEVHRQLTRRYVTNAPHSEQC